MIGQVYITRNANITLLTTKARNRVNVTFKLDFIPQARDITAVSLESNCKDIQLANHFKHLLQNNENGLMGNVEVTGAISFDGESVPRPEITDNNLARIFDSMTTINLKISGDFIRQVRYCCSNDTDDSVGAKIQISNLFAGERNEAIANGLAEMKFIGKHRGVLESKGAPQFGHLLAFAFNGSTWDNMFGQPRSNCLSPKVTLVLSADLSKVMASNELIVGPTGAGFQHTICQAEILEKRRQERANGKTEDVTIVHRSGEIFMYENYLVESSPVFGAMLRNTGFVEASTKKIYLRSLGLEELTCLKKYIENFDIQACVNDLNLAMKMLLIADQYQVDGFKSAITNLLFRRNPNDVTVAQALQLFRVAVKIHSNSRLDLKVLQIFEAHRKNLSSNQDFADFFKKEPNLAMHLFLRATLPKKSGSKEIILLYDCLEREVSINKAVALFSRLVE